MLQAACAATQPSQPPLATELWSRACKKPLLQSRQAKSTIRFGNREYGTLDPKGGYRLGDLVRFRIQLSNGTFHPWETHIIITAIRRKTYHELTTEDFMRSLEQPGELEKYYGAIAAHQEMTMIEFEFAEDINSAAKLVSSGAMQAAKLPAGNPGNFGDGSYTVPLIEHDYPAKTPVMWNAAYAEFGISERNVMLVGDPKNSKAILHVLRSDPNYKGGGAGVGFKDEVFKYLDELDPLAEAIGSVNFILKTPAGKLRGYNTDGLGYALSLEQLLAEKNERLPGKRVLMLGAGGTANSIAFALAEQGAQLVIANRSMEKAVSLARRINSHLDRNAATAIREEHIPEKAANADVIINVSTKGAAGQLESYSGLATAPLPATPETIAANLEETRRVLGTVSDGAIISDINLVKGQTPLLKIAQELGFTVLDGVPMVVAQGVEAFWLLYGALLGTKGIVKHQVFETMAAAARNS